MAAADSKPDCRIAWKAHDCGRTADTAASGATTSRAAAFGTATATATTPAACREHKGREYPKNRP